MSNAPTPARLAERIAYRASFVTGMAAALPYLVGLERLGDTLTLKAECSLPDYDGATDGVELIGSLTPAFGWTRPGFRRHKLACLVRGAWSPMAGCVVLSADGHVVRLPDAVRAGATQVNG